MGKRYENILQVHDYVKGLLGESSIHYDVMGIADEISDFDGLGYLVIRKEYTDEKQFAALCRRYAYPMAHFKF